jgi:DNA-binding transcriptional LysR family regulator
VELARGNIACYAAPQWLLHDAPPQTPADLENYGLIVFNRRSAERAYSFANRTGQTVAVHLRASVRVSDLATALRIAETGAGIVLLPDIITARALEAGSLVPILADWKISGIKLHALTLIGRVPARVRLFREFLKSELRTPTLANRT